MTFLDSQVGLRKLRVEQHIRRLITSVDPQIISSGTIFISFYALKSSSDYVCCNKNEKNVLQSKAINKQ